MKRKNDKGQHSSGRVHPGVDLSVDHSLAKVVSVVIGFAVLRVITAILFDRDPALWGWSYVSFVLTKPDVLIALGLPLLLLFPKVLGTTIRFVDSGASATTRHQRPWRLLFSILIAGFALIYSFPVLAAFLGDGAIILSEVYRLYDPSLQSDFFFKPTSFLTGVLIESIVAMYDTDDLRKIFTILGLIAFVLLVILTRWLLRDERRSVALILGSGMLLSAGSLFFFRYIELYQMQYVFVAGYYLAAWRYLSGRGSLWMPVALLSLAVFFGAAALVHAPTLLIFLYGRGGSAGAVQRKIAIATAAAVPLLALVVSIALSGRVDSPLVHYLIPFSALPVDAGGVAAMNRYTLLSAAHLRDSVNALWLHAGPALTLLILLPVIGGKRDAMVTPRNLFSVVALSCSLTFLVFANALYGLSQDWDLVALIAPAVVFALATAVDARYKTAPRMAGILAVGFFLLQVGHVYPWLRINAAPVSEERFASLVEMNTGVVPPWNTFRSLENLRSYRASVGDVVGEFTVLRNQFLLRVRQESVCRSMQITFHRLPQSRRAEQLDTLCTLLLREARQRSRIQRDGEMDAVRLRECVTSTLLLASSEDEHGIAQRYAREFDPLFSEWPEIGLYYAAANSALKDAQRLEITSISLTPDSRDPALTFLAGWFCEKGGNASLARRYYERTTALAPSEYPAAYLRLSGILHSAFRDSARAAEILRRGIRACTLAPEREEMQQRLREYEAAEP